MNIPKPRLVIETLRYSNLNIPIFKFEYLDIYINVIPSYYHQKRGDFRKKIRYIKHHDEDKEEEEEEEEGRKEGRQKAITGLLWCGTSLSDQALSTLDCSLHTRFSVRKLKAFTINASGATYRPEVNAEEILRNQFEGEEFLILEQGVNEVSNACGENFEEDKQFIASKMRELVELSQELYERNNLKKVVLLKRLIRCDNVKKAELSRYSDLGKTSKL